MARQRPSPLPPLASAAGKTPHITVVAQFPPKSPTELALEAQDRAERDKADQQAAQTNGWLVGIGLAQVGVFLAQLWVFGYQARKLRQTVVAAEQQSADTRESIRQSARSAAAIEALGENMAKSAAAAAESVATVKDRTARQMRAYLTVVIGGATFQEREKNLRFEARPLLVNTGNTPAYDVAYVAEAGIFSVPLPPGAAPQPSADLALLGAVVGPHQNSIMTALVSDFVDDAEVDAVKHGDGKSLYTWGIVTYKDVFGEQHATIFCQQIFWHPNDQIAGLYIAGRNSAD